MKSQVWFGAVLFIIFLGCAAPLDAFEKWLFYPTNLLVDRNVDDLEKVWRRAAAAGYDHVLLADSKFTRLGEMDARYFRNVKRLRALAAELHLEIVPAIFPIGYSNDLLGRDVNLVEGPPVRDLPLLVQGGIAHIDDPDAPTLPGGDFSDPKQWTWKDSNLRFEKGSATVMDPGGKNSRLVQRLKVKPWRQYHVSVRISTKDFKGEPEIKVLPEGNEQRSLQWTSLGVAPTQGWTTHHVVFNSLEYSDVLLYFGAWGGTSGSLSWSEARIEEVAFLNVIRRPGAPLQIITVSGEALVEGRDFEAIGDPLLGRDPGIGDYGVWHAPPELHTKLPDGTHLKASYYHAATVGEHQAAICVSEPATYELLTDQAKRVSAAWGAGGYMMSHDEWRVANWCAACQSRHLTPGELLGDNVSRCVQIMRTVAPSARLYVWSDMFDPHHNAARGPYYLVNGSLLGSWKELPPEVTVLNWNFDKRDESLKFFADRGQHQIIAGYYDSPVENVRKWHEAAQPYSRSVEGIMYTTWRHDYTQLEKFSALADEAFK